MRVSMRLPSLTLPTSVSLKSHSVVSPPSGVEYTPSAPIQPESRWNNASHSGAAFPAGSAPTPALRAASNIRPDRSKLSSNKPRPKCHQGLECASPLLLARISVLPGRAAVSLSSFRGEGQEEEVVFPSQHAGYRSEEH